MGVSVAELIRLAQLEGEVSFYWDSKVNYESSSKSRFSALEDVEFRKDDSQFAKVVGINIPSDRLNVSFRVQVQGQAVNKSTGASKQCSYFADRTVIRNGKPTIPYFSAQLSERVFNACRAAKAIQFEYYDPDKIYQIEVSEMPVVSPADVQLPTAQQLAGKILSLRDLKVKQWALGKKIKDLIAGEPQPTVEQDGLYVNSGGIFSPPSQPSPEEKHLEDMIVVDFIEWDVAKYPEKARKDEALADIESRLPAHAEPEQALSALEGELKSLRSIIKSEEWTVHWSRLISTLAGTPIFAWEGKEIKAKKSTHKSTGENLVVGGEVEKSAASVGDIIVVQNRWKEKV